MKNMLSTPKGKIAAAAALVVLVIAIVLLATGGAGASSSNQGIGMEKSIAVALADAGLKQEQVTNLQGEFDADDVIANYDVSFTANGFEYDYSIKAADGAILECKIESPDGRQVTAEEALDIGQEKALAAALNHAGLKESDVEITKSKKGKDDGRILYEFDFTKGNTKYEYDIDGTTGSVVEFSKEVINKSEADPSSDVSAGKDNASASGSGSSGTSGKTDSSGAGQTAGNSNTGSSNEAGPASSGNSGSSSSDYIGVDKAKSIALENAGVSASDATFTKAKLDRDDGRYQYDIEFYAGDYEYDYEIDALSGRVLDRDWDSIWDD